jgi:TPR repeat protein
MFRFSSLAAIAAGLVVFAASGACAGVADTPKSQVESLREQSRKALAVQDLLRARALAEQAAATGDAEALNDLASLIELGAGGPKDQDRAMAMFEQAYKAGSKAAGLNIGAYLVDGRSDVGRKRACVLLDESYRERTLRAAAAGGLARCYLFGYGRNEDDKRGVDLLEEALRPGSHDPNLFYLLGRTYQQGWGGRAANPAKAYGYFLEGAQLGHPRSMRFVGMCLLEGDGVAKDPQAAFAWFVKSAEAGDPDGQVDLAVMLATGEAGVKLDPPQARKWYRAAAEQGFAHGLQGLGFMQLKGEGGPVDWVTGLAYLELAAEGGNDKAREQLSAKNRMISPADRAEIDRIKADWIGRYGKPWTH